MDLRSARRPKRSRDFIHRTAAGHDVVDHQDDPARDRAGCREGAADVAASRFEREGLLRRRVPDAGERRIGQQRSRRRAKRLRDLLRLVVAALRHSFKGERYGDDHGSVGRPGASRQQGAEHRREIEPRSELQGGHHAVDRWGVIGDGRCPIEVRWRGKAAPALAVRAGERDGAHRATRSCGGKEVRLTVRAQRSGREGAHAAGGPEELSQGECDRHRVGARQCERIRMVPILAGPWLSAPALPR